MPPRQPEPHLRLHPDDASRGVGDVCDFHDNLHPSCDSRVQRQSASFELWDCLQYIRLDLYLASRHPPPKLFFRIDDAYTLPLRISPIVLANIHKFCNASKSIEPPRHTCLSGASPYSVFRFSSLATSRLNKFLTCSNHSLNKFRFRFNPMAVLPRVSGTQRTANGTCCVLYIALMIRNHFN